MTPVVLGSTGLEVSRIGFGASYDAPAEAYERAFHEHGVNFLYWGSMRRRGMRNAIRNLVAGGHRPVHISEANDSPDRARAGHEDVGLRNRLGQLRQIDRGRNDTRRGRRRGKTLAAILRAVHHDEPADSGARQVRDGETTHGAGADDRGRAAGKIFALS